MHTTTEITIRCDICNKSEEIRFKSEAVDVSETALDKADEIWIKDHRGRIRDGQHECYDCAWRADHNYFSISYASHGDDLNIIGVIHRLIDFHQVTVLLDNESKAPRKEEYPRITFKRIPKSLFDTLKTTAKIPELRVVRRVGIRYENTWFKHKAESPFTEEAGNIKEFDSNEAARPYTGDWVLDLGPAIAMFENGEIKQPSKLRMAFSKG